MDFGLDISELVKRALKYFVEGVIVALVRTGTPLYKIDSNPIIGSVKYNPIVRGNFRFIS